jgi:uncharacterized protein (TIGR03435 family)
MRYVACMAVGLLCACLYAQTAPGKPQFEVASVKPAANDAASGRLATMMRVLMRTNMPPGTIPMENPGRILLEHWALLDLIAAAYRVRAGDVSGPAWLGDQGFDVEAKVPEGTPKEQLNGMLQSLLEERFGLKVHRGSQTKAGFALVVGKNGPLLKPAEAPPSAAPGLTEDEQQGQRAQQAQERMASLRQRLQENRENNTPLAGFSRGRWPSITAEGLANSLARFTEAPVADETGLTGKYSVTIETWKNPDVPGGTIFDAVEKLGLKLEPRKITVETVVVDRVSKAPTAN